MVNGSRLLAGEGAGVVLRLSGITTPVLSSVDGMVSSGTRLGTGGGEATGGRCGAAVARKSCTAAVASLDAPSEAPCVKALAWSESGGGSLLGGCWAPAFGMFLVSMIRILLGSTSVDTAGGSAISRSSGLLAASTGVGFSGDGGAGAAVGFSVVAFAFTENA